MFSMYTSVIPTPGRFAGHPHPVVIPDGRAAPARPSRNPRGDGHRQLQVLRVGWVPALRDCVAPAGMTTWKGGGAGAACARNMVKVELGKSLKFLILEGPGL